jgi:hypothetical protein
MLWKSGNIELRIWPLDHCPPHVTAICRADAWTARFEFSMVMDDVSLWDVKPLRNAPTLSVLNRLLKQIYSGRLICRTAWWQIQQTVCLDHAPVLKQPRTKKVSLMPAGAVGAGTVVKGSGIYVPGQGVQTRVNWRTSITSEWLEEV